MCRAGTVGDITSVTPVSKNTASVSSLDIIWKQTDPEPAKSASYMLYRYTTGAAETKDGGTAQCTAVQTLDATEMDDVVYVDSNDATKGLRLPSVDLCDSKPSIDKGRWV